MTTASDLSKAAQRQFDRIRNNKALRFFVKAFGPGKWRTRVVWPQQDGYAEKLESDGFVEIKE